MLCLSCSDWAWLESDTEDESDYYSVTEEEGVLL